MATAIFAAGCFWGVESSFAALNGVEKTAVGYIGGTTDKPTYEDICTGTTGHAEAVEVQFDPTQITYEVLLDHFWQCHDPTTLNQQGPDRGTQYRSAIFFLDPEQEKLANAAKAKLTSEGRFADPVVTEVTASPTFWMAEEYHQQYFSKHGGGNCR